MSVTTDVVETQVKQKPRSLLADFFIRLVKEKPMGTVGGAIVLLLFLTAIFANVLAPYPYTETHLLDKLSPPSAKYILGADNLGRDLLSRIIYGARISMYVGLGASLINVIIATGIGLISGYLGGRFDMVVQRFVDTFLTFPPLLILLTAMSLVGAGLVQVIVVMGINGGIAWVRVVRSAVFAVRENVYVDAARSIGCTTGQMLRRHILPNIMPVMIIIFSMSMAGNILAEASLSFLGLGVPPPTPSWGGMLSGEGRRYMYEAPWLAIWPGAALSLVIFGINMWGDAIRDLLDPRLRGGIGRYGGKKKKVVVEKKTAKTG